MCEWYSDWLPLLRPLLGTGPATQACALTGNGTSDFLVHRPALNPLSHTSQGPPALLPSLPPFLPYLGVKCLFKNYLFIYFLEGGEGKVKEKERNIDQLPFSHALPGH